jgi:glycosyltransferase involved in cell wall biosynthesis
MSSEPIKFSIIMPTYNQANYVVKSIATVLSQDFTEWELIVIDNSSDDGTKSLLAGIKDPRVKVIECKNGGVIAKSRNLGIRSSTNAWIAFLDSDDLWDPKKLSHVARIIQKHNPDFVYHQMRYVSNDIPDGKVQSRKIKANAFQDLLVKGNPIANSSVVVRKSILNHVGLISEERALVGCEDYNTWLKIAKLNASLYYIKQILGGYRIHENNYSTSAKKVIHPEATKEFYSDLPKRVKTKMNSYNCYLLARHFTATKNAIEARANYIYAIKGGSIILRLKASLLLMISILNRNND